MYKRLLQVAFVVLMLVLVSAYFARNALATQIGATALELISPKLHCTHPRVAIAPTLTRVEFGEVECTIGESPVRYAHVEGTSEIALGLFKVESVHLGKVSIDMRDRDVSMVRSDEVGDLASITGMTDMLYKGMIDFGEMYSPDSPPVDIQELSMARAGKREAVLQGFRKSAYGEQDRCEAAMVRTPGLPSNVDIRGLDLRVTPQQGAMRLGIYLSKPKRGKEPDVSVAIHASSLDKSRPHFSFKL